MLKNRHIGNFSVSVDKIDHHPEDVIRILEGMIILKAEYDVCSDHIDYIAVSTKHFDVTPRYCKSPDYIYDINEKGDVVFKKEPY